MDATSQALIVFVSLTYLCQQFNSVQTNYIHDNAANILRAATIQTVYL